MTRLRLGVLALLLFPTLVLAQDRRASQAEALARAQAEAEARRQQMAEQDAQFRAQHEPDEDRAAASANAPFPPAVVYQDLLQALSVDREDGRFGLGFFVLAFPDDDDAKVVLRDASGGEVYSRDYEGQRDGTRTALRFRPSASGGGGFRSIVGRRSGDPPVFEASGDYVLEIENGGAVVSRLPFRVERIESDDPYADAPPRYALTGMWQTHGYVGFEDNDNGRQPRFQFSFWDQLLDPDREELRYEQVRWELRRDGRLIARDVRGDEGPIDVRQLTTIDFTSTERADAGHQASRINRSDFTDGTYEIRRVVKADDFNGGDFTQTVTFEARDGRFVPVGNQDRERAAPADFIEGLNQAFFYPITTTR